MFYFYATILGGGAVYVLSFMTYSIKTLYNRKAVMTKVNVIGVYLIFIAFLDRVLLNT